MRRHNTCLLLSLVLSPYTTTFSSAEQLPSAPLFFENEARQLPNEEGRELFLLCKARPETWLTTIESVIDTTDDDDTLAFAARAMDIIEESSDIDFGALPNVDEELRGILVQGLSELELDGMLESLRKVRRDLDTVEDLPAEDRLVVVTNNLWELDGIISHIQETWESALEDAEGIRENIILPFPDAPGGEIIDFLYTVFATVAVLKAELLFLVLNAYDIEVGWYIFWTVALGVAGPILLMWYTLAILVNLLFHLLGVLIPGGYPATFAARRLECTWTRLLGQLPKLVLSMDGFQKAVAEAEP